LVLVADETVTDAPVALRDELRVELNPTVTLPKLRVDGETPSCPVAVPVPDKAMTSGELSAFETRVRFAVTEAAVLGAKVTLKVTLCPADKFAGSVSPLIEKAALPTLAEEIVTVLPPVFVTVSGRLALLPTGMLPNASVVGLDVTEPVFPPLGFPANPWQPAKSRGSRTTGMSLA
jgi:hypothetical protein